MLNINILHTHTVAQSFDPSFNRTTYANMHDRNRELINFQNNAN